MARTARVRVVRSTQTAPNTGTIRDLATAFGTTANTATSAAFAVGDVTRQFSPSASGPTATLPTAPATATGIGWRDTVSENANEQVRYAAGTWTMNVRLNKTAMTINSGVDVRATAIVYRVNSAGVHIAELGRIVFPTAALGTVGTTVTRTGSFTTGAAVTFNPGDKIQVEVYAQNLVGGSPGATVSGYTVALVLDETSANSGTAFTAQPTYDILYARAQAATAVGSAAAGRRLIMQRAAPVSTVGAVSLVKQVRPGPKAVSTLGAAALRRAVTLVPKTTTAVGTPAVRKAVTPVPKAVTSVGVAGMTRRITASRALAATAVGSAAMARAAIYRKTLGTAATGVAAAARRLVLGRTAAVSTVGTPAIAKRVGVIRAATATGVASMIRRVTATRSFGTSTTGVTGFDRALIFGRHAGATAVGVASGRVDIPIDALNRIPPPGGTPDWPLNAPTKVIAGVTRDSQGAVVGSATVKLIRQSDDQRVSITTSHATTGVYSFTRGGDDPYTYRVVATKAGEPEIHGVSDELVPA